MPTPIPKQKITVGKHLSQTLIRSPHQTKVAILKSEAELEVARKRAWDWRKKKQELKLTIDYIRKVVNLAENK